MKYAFPTTLSSFKRWLSFPNVALEGVSSTLPVNEHFYKRRRIRSVDNISVTLTDGQVLGFRSSHAWKFDEPTRTATFTLNAATTHSVDHTIVYRLLEL